MTSNEPAHGNSGKENIPFNRKKAGRAGPCQIKQVHNKDSLICKPKMEKKKPLQSLNKHALEIQPRKKNI